MSNDNAADIEDVATAAARLAAEIRNLRKAARLSQPQLAERIGYTRQYVSLAERPQRNLPSLGLTRALDDALNADGTLLALREEALVERRSRRPAAEADTATSRDTSDPDGVQADLLRLRRVLNADDLLEGAAPRPIDVLDQAVARLNELRLHARYAQIAEEVPGLLAEILRAMYTGVGDRRRVSGALTLAYRAADGVAFKFGHLDLSGRLIELMRRAAENTDDELLLGSVAYVRTETFFASGDLTTAARSLVRAAELIPHKALATATGAATFGSLHMRAAVVAARLGETDTARDHLVEANSMAHRVPEGVYFGTAFGPASVKVHDLAVNVDLGDAPTAVARSGSWQPPQLLPAERRSHYFIDMARAQVAIGRYDHAHDALRTARQIAPQQVREHPHVRQTLATLKRTRPKDTELANFANWISLR